MASFKQYTASGGASEAFSIPTFSSDEIKVYVDNVLKTATTHYNITSYTANGGTVTWTGGNVPSSGIVRIVRDTTVTTAKATYAAGSSIKAGDLNDNQTQALRSLEEQDDQLIQTYDVQDSAVTTAKIKADNITGALIADDQINSEHYVDGSIDTAHIADSQITSAKIANGTIVDADISGSAAITGSKIVASTTSVAGTMSAADKTKLDGIEASATADQSNAEIRAAVEAASDSNVFTDADHSKLNSIEASATADQSNAEIRTAVEAATDSNVFTDADHSKLNAIEANATADQSNAEIRAAVEAASDSNVFTDADHSKLNAIEASATADQTASDIKTLIASSPLDASHLAADSVTTSEIADAELTTLAGMQTGTASILAAGTTLTATLAEINTVVDGKSVETTISDTDAAYPTSGAVVDYVAAQIAPLGGLEVIANEDSFPTIPASGVVISIADAGGIVVNGSGVSTTARTAGNGSDNVTINGFPSSLYSTTLTDNMGLMVSSTGSSNTYTYHKLLGKEDDIKQLSDDINDFAARYRVASSAPSSSLDNGDLWYDTANAKMMVYSSTNSAWEEVTSTGDFYINTISSYSGTGGNNATFNGTAYRFVLSNPPSSAQQLIVSVNGVIQKPNSGTGQPSEGFALNGSSIVFSAAPATGADYFIITVGSTVAIGTPSDNTVSTAKIQNLAVTTAKIAADAVDGTKIADDAVGAEHIEVLDANLQFGDNVNAQFGDDNDLVIKHSGSNANIENITGDLVIRTVGSGDDIFIDSVDDINIRVHSTDDAIKCIGDGAVELYHNNTKKFETTSSGVLMPDNAKLGLGAHSGGEGDLNIWHNGSGNFIDTKWNLSIRKDDGAETLANFNNNGAVELYYDNSKKLNTESWGVEITGTIRADDFTAQDGHKFKFGNDNDLEIYHSGSHSYIKDTGTGELIIQGSGVNIYDGNNKSLFYGVTDGYAAIYYNNSKKLETNAGGVDVTGVMQCDGITLLDNEQFQCGTNVDLRIYHNSSNNNTYIKESGSGILSVNTNQFQLTNAADTEVIINAVENGNVALYYDNSKKFETNTAGVKVTGQLEISSHAAWPDHSSGYVGKAVFGSGDDLQIFHQNGYNYIYGSTPVYVQSNTVELQSQGGEKYVTCVNDGAVSLYYDNSKKFETGPGGTKFFNESIWGNAGNTDPWTATGDVTQGVLLYSEDVNVKFPISANSNDTIACILNRTNGNGGILEFKYNASVVGTISSNGSSLPSDRNFKTNISDLNLGLSLVNKLKPSQFNYKIDDPNTPVMYGLIAQELEETLTSEGVTKNSTQLIQHHPTDDTESDYDVDYSKLIPILINSIKELSAKIETLETKVAALEAK